MLYELDPFDRREAHTVAYRLLGDAGRAAGVLATTYDTLGLPAHRSLRLHGARLLVQTCHEVIRRSSSPERPALSVDDVSDTNHVLQQVILTLPAAQRSALVLADVAGCTYDEIAAITETDRATVRRRLARARCTVRDTIEDLRWNVLRSSGV